MKLSPKALRANFAALLRLAASMPSQLGNTGRAIKTASDHLDGWRFANNYRDQAPANATSPANTETVPNPLEEFFDARIEGNGITKWRHYFEVYHRHLSKFVGTDVTFLEVGIYSGGSLEMWPQYFGPASHIVGLDIEEACRTYESDQVSVHIGDQADRTFWKSVREAVPKLDVVLDDGGHTPEQQIVTLEETLPYLAPGGVFICEDIHCEQQRFEAYTASLASSLNAMAPKKRNGPGLASGTNNLQKYIHSIHRYPYITVIEKTREPVEEYDGPKHGTEWQPFKRLSAKG